MRQNRGRRSCWCDERRGAMVKKKLSRPCIRSGMSHPEMLNSHARHNFDSLVTAKTSQGGDTMVSCPAMLRIRAARKVGEKNSGHGRVPVVLASQATHQEGRCRHLHRAFRKCCCSHRGRWDPKRKIPRESAPRRTVRVGAREEVRS